MSEPSFNRKKFGCWFSNLLAKQRQMQAAQTALDGADSPPVPLQRGSLTRSGMTLADLKPGECGYIARLNGSTQARLRLLEMGLTPGTHVKVIRAAAFGGPLDVEVRNYQLSLRRAEAAAVWLGDGIEK
jgi:Fe2+ transport system protein FeoA